MCLRLTSMRSSCGLSRSRSRSLKQTLSKSQQDLDLQGEASALCQQAHQGQAQVCTLKGKTARVEPD